MKIENLIGKEGVFTSYEDGAWSELYAGKKCKIIEATILYKNEIGGELLVEFEDGQRLTTGIDEIELI